MDKPLHPKPTSPWDHLHLFILAGFALAQPLYDVLSRNGEFFVLRRSAPMDVWLLMLTLSFVIPGLITLATFVPRIGAPFRAAALTALAGIFFLQVDRRLAFLPAPVLVTMAALSGLAFTLAYYRFRPVRLFLTVLAPSIVLFPLLFILHPKISGVLLPEEAEIDPVASAASPVPVVMVVFDEFPLISLLDADRTIDSRRFPHFAALANSATWYRNASTVHAWTVQAVPALLTGNFGDAAKLPNTAAYPRNLFTLLAGSHDLHVFEPVTQLCPTYLRAAADDDHLLSRLLALLDDLSLVHLHLTLPRDCTASLPPVSATWKDFAARKGRPENRPEQFERFLASLKQQHAGTPRPGLHFLHIAVPHFPWCFLPSGKNYGLGMELNGLSHVGVWEENTDKIAVHHLRHLLQVGYADLLLGRLVQTLKDQGLYDDALLIVTADHGVSFRPGDSNRAVSAGNFPDILRVPLFIKFPHQRQGKIDDRVAQSLDVLPTIAEGQKVAPPWPMQGRSLLSSGPVNPQRIFFDRDKRWDFSHLGDDFGSLSQRQNVLGRRGGLSYDGFADGPYPELLNRKVPEAWAGEEASFAAEIDNAEEYARVDPAASYFPACIKGRLHLGPETNRPACLAIAANGRIRAVARIPPGPEATWSALLADGALVEGKNHIEVYAVQPSESEGAGPLLRRVRQIHAPDAFLLCRKGGEETLQAADGRAIPIVPRVLHGCLDPVRFGSGCYELAGWAVALKKGQPADRMVVFMDDKFLATQQPHVDRVDVARSLDDPRLVRCGFQFVFRAQAFDGGRMRCFAISQDHIATELHFSGRK